MDKLEHVAGLVDGVGALCGKYTFRVFLAVAHCISVNWTESRLRSNEARKSDLPIPITLPACRLAALTGFRHAVCATR
jgi:hypothetical protein